MGKEKIPNGLCSIYYIYIYILHYVGSPYRVTRRRGGAWVDLVSFHAHAGRRLESRIQHTRSYYYYYYRLSRQPPVGGRLESQSSLVSSATHSRLVSGQSFSLSFSVSLFFLCVSVCLQL